MDECRIKRYTECGNGRYYKPSHCRTFFDNEIKPIPTFYDESEEFTMTKNNNRVCCLYRVSTDKQVDFNSNHEADLPMQRKACHKFAESKGWVIVHEEQEEGVSGHKVRAAPATSSRSSRTMPERQVRYPAGIHVRPYRSYRR